MTTPATIPTIRPATRAEAPILTGLLALAFDQLEVTAHLVGDPRRRRPTMRAYFHILVEHTLECGLVEVTDDLSAVALWLPSDQPPIPDYPHRLAEATGEFLPNFQTLDQALDQQHPSEPHEHLAFLGVPPSLQGHGLGGALIAHHLRVLDERGVPAYAEAANHRVVALNHRHGFAHHGPPITPTGWPVSLHPMWRQPRTATPASTAPRADLT